MPFQADFAMA